MTLAPITSPSGASIVGPDGLVISGTYEPLHGYVGVPSPHTDVVDPSGDLLADPDGVLVSELILGNPNLVAGLRPFFTVSIEMFRPAQAVVEDYGWGATPWGDISLEAYATEETTSIRVSDLGYRTDEPVVVYPPELMGGLTFDARIPLGPSQTGVVYGWGEVTIANVDRKYDALISAWNAEGRSVSIRYGIKTWDDTRGIFVDPLADDTFEVFTGVAGPWLLSEFMLRVPLRDASYWTERRLQRTFYAGTGTYEGDAELANVAKPKARGTAYNVPLLLIDRAARIYQYNDGPGEVVALYEGGAESITFASDTTDLYTGSTSSGFYRTDNSRGLIQLGNDPADNAVLTADVVGHFPTAGEQLIVADIARYLLTEDIGIPAALVNTGTFDDAATDYPYEAGFFWASDDATTGDAAVGMVLASFGAKIAPGTDGALFCLPMQAIQPAEVPAVSFSTANIIQCEPRPMAPEISPPPYRFRCAYQHNYTVQQEAGLLGAATDAHRQFVQTADRYAVYYDADTELAYASGNDAPPFGGGLITEADAQEVVDRVGALFGTRRWLFDVTLPLLEGFWVEFGAIVDITYPVHAFQTGASAIVVGRSLNVTEMTVTLTVLV